MGDTPQVGRPDAAAHLATCFEYLHHPDGSVTKFTVFNTTVQSDKVVAATKLRAHRYAISMIHELEQAGYRLVHQSDPPTADAIDASGPKIAKVVCTHCGRHLGQLKVNPDMTITLSSVAQKALAQLPTTCDEHKALTNA